jgi:hypothetical protein
MRAVVSEESAAFKFGEHVSFPNVDTITNPHYATARKTVNDV